MVQTCVDAVLELLSSQDYTKKPPDFWESQVGNFLVDLRFVKMFLWNFVSWDADADLRSIPASLASIWGNYRTGLATSEDWEMMVEKIGRSRSLIKKHSESLTLKSFKCKPLPSHEVLQFLHIILINTDYFLSCRAEKRLLLVKNQIETLKEKVLIFMNLVQFTAVQCMNCKAVEDFNNHVLTWSSKAACLLIFMYLLTDHEFENRAKFLVADLLQEANPCSPEFIEMCLAVITLTKFSRSDILLFVEFVSNFIHLLFKDLVFVSKDDFEKLREGSVYLFVYLAGPPATSGDNSELILIQNQIDAVLHKASHLICLFGEDKVDSESVQDVLVEVVNMIDQVREKCDHKHLVQIPHSSWSNFPRTNGLGFVQSLLLYLQDLEEEMNTNPKFVHSLKQHIITIKEELASLRPFLQDISHLLNEHKDVKDLWEEIITVAHQAELAIKQSFFLYHPFCLSYVLLKIQDIKHKIMRVKGNDIYRTGKTDAQGYEVLSNRHPTLMSSSNVVKKSVPTFEADGVVGFEEEEQELVNRLTRGTTKLGVVSIVGMGGIGKTTLAMKLLNQKAVMYHFHVRAFCMVSQVYRRKDLLLGILSYLNDVKLHSITEEDLDERLYKQLKGRRYLIVLDDIWNISAWNDVKTSFPDDGNGSRVIFTTRISNVPMLANLNSFTHMLRFLKLDESWDLLQHKIFHNSGGSRICK